jgi:hypothetical protein
LPFSKEPLKIFVLIDFMADTGFAWKYTAVERKMSVSRPAEADDYVGDRLSYSNARSYSRKCGEQYIEESPSDKG